MSRELWTLTAAAALAVLAACGGDHATDGGTGEQAGPVRVELAVAAVTESPAVTAATGSVEPWLRVSPGSKILGRVQEVRVRAGDRVERGQLLAILEGGDLQAAVEQARAAVAMAQANLVNARAQHERMEDLHERGSVTDKNLEDALAGLRVAEASVRQAEANLTAARVNLGYSMVRSPVTGWIVEKRVEAGDMASPGMAFFTVEDLSRVKVVVRVPEGEVVGLEVGAPAVVTLDVLETEYRGTVDRVAPAGDAASRTFDIEIVLENPEGRIRSGMFARVRFQRGTRQALRIPERSVVRRGQLEGVFVVAGDGVARLRWARFGRTADGLVEVLSGLEAGERYVVAPPAGLTDGARVTGR
jgi:RND family efflux transporter MFP subunit